MINEKNAKRGKEAPTKGDSDSDLPQFLSDLDYFLLLLIPKSIRQPSLPAVEIPQVLSVLFCFFPVLSLSRLSLT